MDDEPSIADVVSSALTGAGHVVTVAFTGIEALRAARDGAYDLVVMDVMLPDLDGFEVCRRLRSERVDVAMLFLTARTAPSDVAEGLGLGGDDYLRKPFALEELIARVDAVLRRTGAVASPEVLRFADVRVDTRTYTAHRGGRRLDLTPTELKMLEALVRNAGRILTRHQLVELVWDEPGAVDTNAVETVVSRLRRKLDGPSDAGLLVTRRGVGYGLVARPTGGCR